MDTVTGTSIEIESHLGPVSDEEVKFMDSAKVDTAFTKVDDFKSQGDAYEQTISSWQLIFQQSKVNNGVYNGDQFPAQHWEWPRETWFQTRLRYLRKVNRKAAQALTEWSWQ